MSSVSETSSSSTADDSSSDANLIKVALVGNPNTGKTTVFNRLTGLRQRIGNYPGVTVEKKSGVLTHGDRKAEIVDLPGSYSLAAHSPDERIVVDVLSGVIDEVPDLVVCVLDATNLKRNLFLASQIAELEIPMILVLNQIDAARDRDIQIEIGELASRSGVPVIPTSAPTGEGIPALQDAIFANLDAPQRMRRIAWPEAVTESLENLKQAIGDDLGDSDAIRILFDTDSAVAERVFGDRSLHRDVINEARENLRKDGLNAGSAEAVLHYRHLDETILDGVIEKSAELPPAATDGIDRILLNRFFGPVIFVVIMWLIFQSVYAWAGPLMDLIDAATGWTQELVAPWLVSMPTLQSLVVDGIIAGVGGVLIFLPQIFILFFFIGLLEDTGYMARAAFLMDKLFGWCGLNGKSFVPLMSSYACAIPGIMATRTLADPKARLTTIMMAPLMSCSARLPVYVLLIGAFVEPAFGSIAAGWVLFGMHFVGLLVSLPLAWVTNRFFLKITPLPFVLEMPHYRTPRVRDLAFRVWEGGREFIVRAGTVILAFSVVIWALLYFPRDAAVETAATKEFIENQVAATNMPRAEIEGQLNDEESPLAEALTNWVEGAYVEASYMGQFGKAVQPVFEPAGYDWKITVGVLSSFPAREVIIATLGIIYRLGADVDEESESLTTIIADETWPDGTARAGQPVFTIPVVFSVMVFFALCMQCGATVAVIKQELNWRWAAGSFFGMTALAWIAAVIVYQVGTAISS